ncbi:hypothetical protein L218DRAFT_946476 [Marasmius fiardii PR-910]|nr:hypothetical protein L218DRAFT_946476 [Marasmius fiardii PR-910]
MNKSFFTIQNLLLSAILLLSALSVKGEEQCPTGYELVETEFNEFHCQRVGIVCTGEHRDYVDLVNGARSCCDPSKELTIYDEDTRLGAECHRLDHSYFLSSESTFGLFRLTESGSTFSPFTEIVTLAVAIIQCKLRRD